MPENRGYAVWVYSGILLQILLIQGLTVAAGSIQRNLNVITKNRIPPVIMAFSASLAHSINFFLGSFLILPLCFLTNQQISLRLLFFPFYIILSAIALTGFGILVTGLFMKYDDTIFIFNAGTMVLSYLTPIFYPIQILSGSIYTIVSLNPLTSWILTLRWIFLEESRVEIFNLFVVLGSSLGLFLAGTMTLKYRWKYWQML
jgi:ABC-type polysaccharide/polyol phosphate export permease